MLVGLQGCGKTTIAAKLARQFRGQNRPALLVAADLQRPAAVDQLKALGAAIQVPVFSRPPGADPVDVCREGVEEARRTNRSVVILDTAGRLSIDEEMMDELVRIQQATQPHEVLFVADAMLGQDAVETARRFHERLEFTGVILSKMDSDARGGPPCRSAEVTGKPIKFVGTGEKVEDLEPFHPDRMASRILGMATSCRSSRRPSRPWSATRPRRWRSACGARRSPSTTSWSSSKPCARWVPWTSSCR